MDGGSRTGLLLSLSQGAGNAAVQRALSSDPGVETQTRTDRYQLTARIPMRDRDGDGDDGGAGEPRPEQTAGEGEAAAEQHVLGEGETADLPDYTSSYPEDGEADSISASLAYSPTVTVLGDEPKTTADFGSTWGNHIKTSGGKIHQSKGTITVTQTIENPITIKVYKDTGPHGQVNIESETDPDIKAGNYTKVADDLTPGKDDKPSRGKFWARDLTLEHEQFHAKDGQKFCKDAVTAEQDALNKATASTIDEVNALMSPIADRVVKARGTGLAPPGNEERAYKAGAAGYKDRADKIRAQGKAGKYTASLDTPGSSDEALAGGPEPAETGDEPAAAEA